MANRCDVMPLVAVIERLCAEDGCPWDRVQTHETMRKYLIEEAYEVCDAIDRQDTENLREELGDVLFQIVFHALLEEKAGRFDLQAVVNEAAQKMKARHPHIYSSADNGAEMPDWETLKREEKAGKKQSQRLPGSFPATMKLEKLMGRLLRSDVSEERMLALGETAVERASIELALACCQRGENLNFTFLRLADRMETLLEEENI